MLIPSPRHRPEDLRLWAEHEEADRLHYRLGRVAEKEAKAVEAIRAFAAAGPCYVSVSWGKDSLVVAWLARLAEPAIPLVHVHYETLEPDAISAVRDEYLARFPSSYHEASVASPLSAGDSSSKAGGALIEGLELGRIRAGIDVDRYIYGLRSEESSDRRKRMWSGATLGRSCAPIGFWSTADVFAFLAVYDLPVHPVYAMLGGGRWLRDRIRLCNLGGPRGAAGGRTQWELEYFGAEMRLSLIHI
jgi:phosphoadenosine phosphosulfate reductase